LIYGIWPGVVNADLISFQPVDAPAEDPDRTLAALVSLQGRAERFYVRCFRHFGSGVGDFANIETTPSRPSIYAGDGRHVDLVCSYQSTAPDPDGFAQFVREGVRDLSSWGGGKVQIGEELNMPAPLDGGSPGCFDAVAAGVEAALDERARSGADVLIGVNAAGLADEAFWQRLAGALSPTLVDQLDYIGLDVFPDVFHPVPLHKIADATRYVLHAARQRSAAAGFSTATPLHITETGWPTGANRDNATQAHVLEMVFNAVLDAECNVTAYELFGLRDVRTDGHWQNEWGLLRDDYSPKPSFDTVCRVFARHLDSLSAAGS
jgi:hypothetical protein